MTVSTMGVKLDDDIRARLRDMAAREGRTPHHLVKQVIIAGLERLERGEPLVASPDEGGATIPFLEFAQDVQPQSVLRAAITGAYRRPEPEAIAALIDAATLTPSQAAQAKRTALNLVTVLRSRRSAGLIETLLQEYALSSHEGVALMCLAEALLRIPDAATRDKLIRDKIGAGDWRTHIGESPSLFVNAATWGLLLTGKLTATSSETGLSAALTKLLARGGEPIVRHGVNIAMRLMGEQFVMGQTIAEALANARKREAKGFLYSYDMLGEAALTAADAARYYRDYEQAINAIGAASRGSGLYQGPGISIKLSALHPRYCRAQRARVMAELGPRLTALALLARRYDIGLNIDAEEADRLDLSLDLLKSLCFEPSLAGWNGIGFVVQAYQKRAPFVIDDLIDLARRSGHRLMVRLVKGAYWDSEIKRAQLDGLEDFPVYTRKIHTDISYLACARKMLGAGMEIFPQFATHNALTLASIHALAGPNFTLGQYEFQCLHGMGEALYDEVVGPQKLKVPCRIYAPVGTHETLLAYLVRRLLENGANTSFVNKLADHKVRVEHLLADPVEAARKITPLGAPHEKIAAPTALFGNARRNAAGFDLSNEQRLGSLAAALLASLDVAYHAAPDAVMPNDIARPIVNPADFADRVGTVVEASSDAIAAALAAAETAAPIWQVTPPADRSACLTRAAGLLEQRLPKLIGLIVREAGKTIPAAIGEAREAVDFLRYYAAEIADGFDNATHRPLGIVAAISPWNFPLSIFMGQVAAGLAAGNVVLAKPAEETPLIAAVAVSLLREAGVPPGAVALVPGDGSVGAALVADARVRGVIFTGSTPVAHSIQATLAQRLDPSGLPVPLIAETGGQNAMLVDSSALLEQAVGDIVTSAFDSAGQRCSALRILLVQNDIADALIRMLKGAMAELAVNNPDHLASDIGPVISEAARRNIQAHCVAMERRGCNVFTVSLPPGTEAGWFMPPTLIEIADPGMLDAEIFGPVLHVVRYTAPERDRMIDAVNALGYALTFGIHSRIDETIAQVSDRIEAGNIYINRNIVGAVVGVQPFGGHGLSGTGPKAGGPLYLRRLLAMRPPFAGLATSGMARDLAGPVGEHNTYRLAPRGTILCHAATSDGALRQIAACLATGNTPLVWCAEPMPWYETMPIEKRPLRADADQPLARGFDAVLFAGDSESLSHLLRTLTMREGPIVPVHAIGNEANPAPDYPLEFLFTEQSISVNTAAAGGNASLMTIG
ncbi:MAG: trifunctional transcriptional regulator/proline dehydrogenase/L-glutamate gamma-semialdehyde dehydrogenase [Acidiphilium sp.]|nr:trifunctional transcriptional regulator/proline dehydrogenase/L-glutamate gamma-semialdehyde dehydrogenase [Acidiphilium sp.]MDD4935415.1 trifunctional transcriptional regulator/proline dehydrogenase/L-glutamate gamma-semialdehyde dehydrogenase [Acidiphilium sp.]